eukprot:GHVU01181857.1.p1 GENE.GHVU01181857.1~~GHVU01181857.1.p1  ORF type:complete len:308 (+),score=26.78 GHVU01181857.1:340-1263(+)
MLKIIFNKPWSQFKTGQFYQDVFCEFVLSFFLLAANVLISCSLDADGPGGLLQVAMTAGILVATLIESFGHVSLALFNPSLTYVMVCTGQLNLVKGIVYGIVQVAGGALGSLVAIGLVTKDMANNLKPFTLAPGLSDWQAVCIETFISGLMLIVVLGAADNTALRKPSSMFGLPIGFTVIVGILAAGNLTGGVINPIVAVGRSIATGVWDYHWVYWLGHILGGTAAFLLYELFILKRVSCLDEYIDAATTLQKPLKDRKKKETSKDVINKDKDNADLPTITVMDPDGKERTVMPTRYRRYQKSVTLN